MSYYIIHSDPLPLLGDKKIPMQRYVLYCSPGAGAGPLLGPWLSHYISSPFNILTN